MTVLLQVSQAGRFEITQAETAFEIRQGNDGIDIEIGPGSVVGQTGGGMPDAHASTHITDGSDQIDGDKLDIDWTPTNYTPTISPAEADNLDNLTAHLAGIDAEFGSMASGQWTDAGTFLYPTETTDNVIVGAATEAAASHVFDATGTSTFRVDTSTAVGIHVIDSTEGSNEWIRFTNAASAIKFEVDPLGRMGLGTDASAASGRMIDAYGKSFQLTNEGTPDSFSAQINFRKARGSLGSPGVLLVADDVGGWSASGYDGGSYVNIGSHVIEVESIAGVGDISGQHTWRIRNTTNSSRDSMTLSSGGDLDVIGSELRLGASSATGRADATNKTAHFVTSHYTNAEEFISLAHFSNTATENTLQIGGGNGSYNASTKIGFYSGATNTTLGGTLRLTIEDDTILGAANTIIDLGDSTSFEVPNSATPTVDADGEIALDTTVADFSHGVLKYFGGEEMAVVALPIAELTTPTDGHVVAYNATNDEFELVAAAGGGSSEWTLTTNDLSPNTAATTNVIVGGTTQATGDIVLNADGSAVFNEQGASVKFRVEGGSEANAIYVETNGRVGIGTNAPSSVLGIGGDRILRFIGGTGTITDLSSISTPSNNLVITASTIRVNADVAGAALNVKPANTSQIALAVQQFTAGTSKVITIEDSAGTEVLGITADSGSGAFIATSAAGDAVYRFGFEHAVVASTADGHACGIRLRPENNSGLIHDAAYFDALMVDVSAFQAAAVISVKDDSNSVSTPVEVARFQNFDSTTAVNPVLRLQSQTTGTPANDIGLSVVFRQETTASNYEDIAEIQAIATDVTATSEDGAIVFSTMKGGAAATEDVRINGTSATLLADQSETAGAKPPLYLDQADISEEMIEFNTTIGVGNAIEAKGAKTLTETHYIKVTIPGGLTRYFPVGTIA